MTRPRPGAIRGRPRLLPDAPSQGVSLRLPSDLLARVHDEASASGRAVSAVVRAALELYLDRTERRR